MLTATCQRWREGRDTRRPAGEPLDPRRYGVELIAEDGLARAFVCRHHYAGTYVAARLRVGLYRARRWISPELVGVAVFSVPMSQHVIPRWTGQDPAAGVELGRLVLLDEVEANAESWFLARAFRLLQAALPEVRAVVSFSDPLARRTLAGDVVTPGHVGTVYQALSARHTGRTKPQWHWLTRDGRFVSPRALSKIRGAEVGIDYACRDLVRMGAPPRRLHEEGADYVQRALAEGPFVRVRHPGNLGYVWALGDRRQRRQVEAGFGEPLPYPKARDAVIDPQKEAA